MLWSEQSQSSGKRLERRVFKNQKHSKRQTLMHLLKFKNTYCHHCSQSMFWLHRHYCSDIMHQGTFLFRSLNMSCGLVWRMSSCDTLTISDCSIVGGKGKLHRLQYVIYMIYYDRCSVVSSLLLHSQKQTSKVLFTLHWLNNLWLKLKGERPLLSSGALRCFSASWEKYGSEVEGAVGIIKL